MRNELEPADQLARLLDAPPEPASAVYEAQHLVSMIDVDAAQIHYSSYIRWMDLGTNGLLANLGVPIQAILAGGGSLPVADVHCAFHAPVSLGEVVICRSFFTHCGRTSIHSRHDFTVGLTSVATGTLVHVWMSRLDGRLSPQEVPHRLRAAATLADGTTS